jgi:hypothetical protein
MWVPVGKGATREVFGLVTTLPDSAADAAVFSLSKQMADFSGTLHRLGGVSEKMVVERDPSIVVPLRGRLVSMTRWRWVAITVGQGW